MALNLLIGIEPPKNISGRIKKMRRFITDKTRKNLYGNHEPHITLYVNSFPDYASFEKQIIPVIEKQAAIPVAFEGIDSFTVGVNANSRVIIYKLKENKGVRSLQSGLIKRLNTIRTPDLEKWYMDNYPVQTRPIIKNIKQYGFPFGPKDYVFHASIGTVPEEMYSQVMKQLKCSDCDESWVAKEAAVFIDKGDGFKIHRKYAFGARNK